MPWDIVTARAVAGIPPDDTTRDTALQFVMRVVLSGVERFLERELFWARQIAKFYHVSREKLWLPRYPITAILRPANVSTVHYRAGWVEGPWPTGEIEIEWEGGFPVLPPDLEWVLWGAFQVFWGAADPATGLPSQGAAVLQGTGEVKSLTVFDAYKIDYDVGASVAGSSAGDASARAQAMWGPFAPWASILMLYRRNVGGA